MQTSFYFYDLETSGFNPKQARIMQFAGQRTDMEMRPVGEPHNILIKMTNDTLPDPGAIMVTGITPQQTVTNGITEAEFLDIFHKDISTPGTIFTGFNTVRFDDEFMRFMHYRNFYDPYEWHWKDDRSRWDLLDLTRMTRALRPDGIEWPVSTDGTPTNKLELLASVNKLEHIKAHDALSDVLVSIEWAKLIHTKQPKLFNHLLTYRDKRVVAEFVESRQPFVYSSGKYASTFEKTTVAAFVSQAKEPGAAVVMDLRYSPAELAKLSAKELVERWQHFCRDYPCPHKRAPLKSIKYNRCPAVAPLGVLDDPSWQRIELELKTIEKHAKELTMHRQHIQTIVQEALELMKKQRQQRLIDDEQQVDARLYEGFFAGTDKQLLTQVRQHDMSDDGYSPGFKDERLQQLYPLYRARNYPKYLSSAEQTEWEKFRKQRLLGGEQSSWAAKYFKTLEELAKQPGISNDKKFLLEELQLWGESILPVE